jgi:hypothetical protein
MTLGANNKKQRTFILCFLLAPADNDFDFGLQDFVHIGGNFLTVEVQIPARKADRLATKTGHILDDFDHFEVSILVAVLVSVKGDELTMTIPVMLEVSATIKLTNYIGFHKSALHFHGLGFKHKIINPNLFLYLYCIMD